MHQAVPNLDYSSIFTPGTIQPHGMLFVLQEPELTILQVSDNTQHFFDISAHELLERSLETLLTRSQIDQIQQCLAEDLGTLNPIQLSIRDRAFDAIVHRTETAAILEIEPTQPPQFNPHNIVRKAVAKLQKTTTLNQLLQQAVIEVQRLTGFDRVHVYQFDEQGAGTVIAEKKREDLSSYLGLRFPALDIPNESRELYRQGLVRFVPDVNVESIAIIPNGHDLDLSFAMLRSLDPCCAKYYQALDSAALFVLPLIFDQQLWGLVSCHHQTPRWLGYDLRSACELLGQFIALELMHKADQAEFNHWMKRKALQSDLIASISQVQSLRDALVMPAPRLLDFVSAQGAAVCLGDEITLVGSTPSASEIAQLITWVEDQNQMSDNLFHTNSLSKLYPPAAAFCEIASGVLLLQISQVQRCYVLWFRSEVPQTINWAGNPTVSIAVAEDGSFTISGRSSFERWQEIVQQTSLPWQPYELNSVLDLRTAIVGIVLKKADELASLNLALERSNRELDSFAFAASHDLKEPLRGIYNNAVILLEDYADVLDPEGIDGLQTTVRLAQRMEMLVNTLLHFSQLGNVELHLKLTDLNQLVAQTIQMLQASRPETKFDIRIPRSLPTIECDPVLVNEVFSNLLSNAFKYNNQKQPWAEVGYLEPHELTQRLPGSSPSCVFYVRDNGIGIRAHHQELIFKLFKRLHAQEDFGGGTGAGLTIAKKIVERHGGKLWVESIYREGSIFYFSLR
jgi:chemotaxis family two-component system sensor kinase Cph1